MPNDKLHNESALVRSMQSGDEEAFTTLYRYYSPRLYLNIIGMIKDPALAEELVQELFTRIWQHRSSPGMAEDFTGYMYRIALNLVHDLFRRIRRDLRLRHRWIFLATEGYEYIEQQMHHRQLSGILEQAIDQLPKQQKRAWQLVKLEGHTYKKAAQEMGISPLTVKEYLVAAHKSIRASLSDHAGALIVLLLATLPLFS